MESLRVFGCGRRSTAPDGAPGPNGQWRSINPHETDWPRVECARALKLDSGLRNADDS
jgi:hypothetical protein